MKILKTLMNKKFSKKDLRQNLTKLSVPEQEINVVIHCIRKLKHEKHYEKAIYFAGCSFFHIEDYENAVEYLTLALELNPINMDAFIMKSDALYSQGEYDEAFKCLDEALKVNPGAYDVYMYKACKLYDRKRYEEACESLDKASAIKADPYGFYLKGNCLYNQIKYEEAISCYDRALNMKPEYIDALIDKGKALSDSGKYDKALECFDKALEIDPKNVFALGEKGLILLKKKDYKGSLDCYDRVLSIDSNYSDVYLYKAKALTGMGHYRKALKCYDMSLKLDPSYKKAKEERERFIKDYYISQNILEANEMVKKGYAGLRGYVYTSNKTEDAMKCFDRALDLDPENTDAWVGKAETLTDELGYTSLEYGASDELLANAEKAVECYDMALQVDPSDESLYTGKMSMLRFLVKEGKESKRKAYNEEIIEVASELLRLNPRSRQAYQNKGYAFASLGMKEEALEAFDTLVSYYPDDADVHRNRGEACFSLGLYEEALKSLNKFLSYYPDYYSDSLVSLRSTLMYAVEMKGDVLYKEEKYMEAISCYEEARNICNFIGFDDQFYVNYLDGDPGSRRLDVMKKELSDMFSIPVKEKNPHEWVEIGYALKHFNLVDKAGRCFEKARELDPNMVIN